MRWIQEDRRLREIEGRSRAVDGNGDRKLPWWFWNNWLRPWLKTAWDSHLIFGANVATAATGYKIGFVVNGHAYVGDEVLYHQSAMIELSSEYNWTIFLMDKQGNVISCLDGGGSVYIDEKPISVDSGYQQNRPIVD